MQSKKNGRSFVKYNVLEKIAGVDELLFALESTKTPFGDDDFEDLVAKILLIQAAKRHQYGDYIEARDESPYIALFENFTDLKRKYVRLDVAIKRDYSFKDLAEGYLDLAIYGLLGLQLLFHIEENKDVSGPDEPTRSSGA
jgi:hypothetical protein